MREEITAICERAPQVWEECLRHAARSAMTPTTTVLAGCGDSYYAGLAMRPVLEALIEHPVISWPAMDVVSYPSRILNDADLVAVSVSGKVGRTIDAVDLHNARGGATFAVTAYPDSDLARTADAAIPTGVRGTPGPVPGTANYVASLLGLLAFGVVRGGAQRPGVEDAVPAVLAELPSILERATDFFDDVVTSLSEPVFAVGSGPDWGTANFAVAKLLEAAGAVGVPQDLEEWAHEQYFATRDDRTVLVIGHEEVAAQAARQVIDMATAVGGRTIAIGQDFGASAKHAFDLPGTPPGLSPLVTWLPVAVLALTFAQRHGRVPFGIDRAGRMETVDKNIYIAAPSRA
ncbi:SIS domain-containing protein [Dactylosporangium roseum]